MSGSLSPTQVLLDSITQKLRLLKYPHVPASSMSLLFAGCERYTLLEWLFRRLRGDDGPIPSMDGDSQELQLHRLADAAAFLGFSAGPDTGVIEGSSHGTSEDRARFLLSIVTVVAAAFVPEPTLGAPGGDDALPGSYADNAVGCNHGSRGAISGLPSSGAFLPSPSRLPSSSPSVVGLMEQQQEREGRLLDAICGQHKAVFSTECRLFPADVRLGSDVQAGVTRLDASYFQSDLRQSEEEISSLERRCMELKGKIEAHRKSFGLGPKDASGRNGVVPSTATSHQQEEAFQRACGQLAAQLAPLLETVRHFQAVFNAEIRPWTHKVDAPKLDGLGQAATQILGGYAQFQKLVAHVRSIRQALESLSDIAGTAGQCNGGSGLPGCRMQGALDTTGAPQKLVDIGRRSEEALTALVDMIDTLASSCARERQHLPASEARILTGMLGKVCAT